MSALDTLFLTVSALCGIGFGYAAQRGNVCAVAGVEEWIEHRSTRQLRAFFLCSLWVLVATVPLVWLGAGAHLAAALPATATSLAGGLMFGVGAALNGGCAFGTITRLGAGDASFLATLAGMAAGTGLWLNSAEFRPRPIPLGPSILETPSQTGLVLIVAAVAVLLWLSRRHARPMAQASRWTPEHAAAMMGVTGGLLYALNGPWAYTLTFERVLGAMMMRGIADWVVAVIFVAAVGGAVLGARRRHMFVGRLNARAMPSRFAAGVVMGVAASLMPGGNDDIVLHAIPALSPHVLVAYPALIAGIAAMLIAGRASTWSTVASATPARVLRSIVSWRTSGRE